MDAKVVLELFKDAFYGWVKDKAPQLSAALSFYTIFSLAPLLVIGIAVAGWVFGREAVQAQVFTYVQGSIGEGGALFIQNMIESIRSPGRGIFAALISVVIIFYAASNIFYYLKGALNDVWNVSPVFKFGIKEILKGRFLSIMMTICVGSLLLVSFAMSIMFSALDMFVKDVLPGIIMSWQIADFVISSGVVMLLFAMLYKILPDADIKWSDVWAGAVLAALLFKIGEFLIGFYLGRSGIRSIYGAAGSFVAILIWVYYSAQVFFFGAEFICVYTGKYGSKVKKDKI